MHRPRVWRFTADDIRCWADVLRAEIRTASLFAAFMTGRPAPSATARWIEDEETVRYRWHELVAARRVFARPR